MEKALVLTNNPLVLAKYPQARMVKGTYQDVLIQGRNLIHQGHRLVNHPLAGSIKPNETPYKSLLLTAFAAKLDFASLSLIESAIQAADKFVKLHRNWDQKVDADFQYLDLTLLQTAVEQLPPGLELSTLN